MPPYHIYCGTGTDDNTPCTLVYSLSAAKDDHTGVKDAAALLAAQDGTLGANLDVRVGEGTIQIASPGLDVTTQPVAQFAIFKFTTKNITGSTDIDITSLPSLQEARTMWFCQPRPPANCMPPCRLFPARL